LIIKKTLTQKTQNPKIEELKVKK